MNAKTWKLISNFSEVIFIHMSEWQSEILTSEEELAYLGEISLVYLVPSLNNSKLFD